MRRNDVDIFLDMPLGRGILLHMTLTVHLPPELEALLRRTIGGDLDAYAREALAVQLYRDRKLTHGQLQLFLGVSSYAADTILKKHGGVDELTAEELLAQVAASAEIRRKQMAQ
jgi:hypothetical protein